MKHPSDTRSEQLLAGIGECQAAIAEQEIATVRMIAEWARGHTVAEDDEDGSATITERGLDTRLPVAGEGAPLISDFALMELSALLGRSLDSGRHYVGQVVELAHRLPRIWARVLEGEVAPRLRSDLHLQPRRAVSRPPPDEDRPQGGLRMLEPGIYHWTLPSGSYLVTPAGTHHLSPAPLPDR